ncbi:MAG TPA: T9SS type A sorting domain-containing protein, partial [Bacteroidales bacterium]|nr:T9SS type A sorting domain-containing protein [Bacteroidales bacterium]
FVTGSFKEVCYFNELTSPQSYLVSNGSYDVFIARYEVPSFIVDPGETQNEMLKLFPNPAQNQITISNSMDQIGLPYILSDATGKEIFRGELSQLENIINISDLKQGVYFVKVKTSRPSILKFVKY